MKKGDREKVQVLILQAIREWYELKTNVSLSSYIAEWLLQNDMAFVVRCKDCKHWVHMEAGNGDCTNGRFHLPGHADPTMGANDFCSCGERKSNG